MSAVAQTRARAPGAWVQVGLVLAAWGLLVAGEHVVVGFAYARLFAGSWEMAAARRYLTPIVAAALLPAAALAVIGGRVADASTRSRRARAGLAIVAAIAGVALGWGVSYGRHVARLVVRAPFVAVVAAVSAAAAFWLVPAIARAARVRPRVVGAVGLLAAALAWAADALVLPRLYPAFHAALFAATLGAAALGALVVRAPPGEAADERVPRAIASLLLAFAAASAALAPWAARRLRSSDNLRLVLTEHAPILGRGVLVANLLAPPPPFDESAPAIAAPGEIARALDWTGRDVVLITVDALRADHVSAYGYARKTTPSLDALAREGAIFDHAYCPTPHTSYSITSMMTGKYMRPLLAMGLGQDSETWAGLVRRYGARTAAFYPPAVFFIDEDRFSTFEERGLDFEYRKVEFASPALRARQMDEYLAQAPADRPLFLWVHFFEPHEPYVAHAEHPFTGGEGKDVDAYDSEIAAADDGIGAIVRAVRAKRPNAVFLVTADHGEEFGDHGGRYHGTSVYEEQVRVPLVVVGPGVSPGRITTVVQTIDLFPTVISALGIPRPARVRGRDLGPILARAKTPDGAPDPGIAFAETDAYALVARGDLRLVCERRASACALYDVAKDPREERSVAAERPADVAALRRAMASIAGEHGRFERGEAQGWPEALRRGMAGDADAAEEVASLLDDASAPIRAKAAEVSFDLHVPSAAPQMTRALAKSEDDVVRRWAALALVRMRALPASPLAEALVTDPDPAWRRRAALAFAEVGDGRGAAELLAWWGDRAAAALDFAHAEGLLDAIAAVRPKGAAAAIAPALEDVRLRAKVAETLGKLGDPAARGPLLAALARERYVTARSAEARALRALGAAAWSGDDAARHVDVRVPLPRDPAARAGRWRLFVLTTSSTERCDVTEAGAPIAAERLDADVHAFDLPSRGEGGRPLALDLTIDADAPIAAIFVTPAPP